MSTNNGCLIKQANCGRIAGNPICPKCGVNTETGYTTPEAVMLAQAQASAKYWQSEATEMAHRSAVAEAERQELEWLKSEEVKRQAEEEKQRLTLEQAKRNPGQVFQDSSTAPQMVVLPSGSYLMGSDTTGWFEKVFLLDETPKHKVTIAHKLAMGRYPVTFEEWDACVADGGISRKPKDHGWGRGQRPVIDVSWDDAQAYIAWLNKKLGIAPKDPHRYRLPSEAEWEYACRAGSQTQWCFGDDVKQLTAYAWYDKNSGGKTQPVGQKKANAFGLHDMYGNVWEWVQDYAHDNYNDAPDDGTAWEAGGPKRVLRGGAWIIFAGNSRSASRISVVPDFRISDVGFRLARTVP